MSLLGCGMLMYCNLTWFLLALLVTMVMARTAYVFCLGMNTVMLFRRCMIGWSRNAKGKKNGMLSECY